MDSQHSYSLRLRTLPAALLRLLAAISLLAVGGVHIQQYIVQDYRVIPTIGPLFLLNFIGGTVLGLYFLIPVSRHAGRIRLLVDAVAALAVLSQVNPPHRVRMVLEGESLLNDASALLIYRLAVGAVAAGRFDVAQAIPTFALVVLGRSKDEMIDVVEAIVDEGGLPALRDLSQELDTGAVELDALLDLVNTARFRLSSAVANVYPDGP